jgi:ribosomal protein L12E/L44/L45/RPP1/RPP2
MMINVPPHILPHRLVHRAGDLGQVDRGVMLVAALADVNIDDALKAPVFAAATAPAAPAVEVKEEKKVAEKPKVEEKKEEDLQGLGALFG